LPKDKNEAKAKRITFLNRKLLNFNLADDRRGKVFVVIADGMFVFVLPKNEASQRV